MGNAASAAGEAGEGGRAGRLGPHPALTLGIAVAAILLGMGALLAIGSRGSANAGSPRATSTPTASARYGGLPSWLPKPKVQVGRVLHASVSHPALSIQGEAVVVQLAGGWVLATAVGPQVPEEGRFPVPAVTPVTFIVSFARGSHAMGLNGSAFKLIDERGSLHQPKMTAVGGGRAPARIMPGRAVSVELHDILPTGDGGLSWTPEGGRPVVTWDYTVEID